MLEAGARPWPRVAKRFTQDTAGRKPPATSQASYAPVGESHSSSERKPHHCLADFSRHIQVDLNVGKPAPVEMSRNDPCRNLIRHRPLVKIGGGYDSNRCAARPHRERGAEIVYERGGTGAGQG